jgi:hypothetical protein
MGSLPANHTDDLLRLIRLTYLLNNRLVVLVGCERPRELRARQAGPADAREHFGLRSFESQTRVWTPLENSFVVINVTNQCGF